MKRSISILVVTALVSTVLVPQPVQAINVGAGAAGFAIGALMGAAMASRGRYHGFVYRRRVPHYAAMPRNVVHCHHKRCREQHQADPQTPRSETVMTPPQNSDTPPVAVPALPIQSAIKRIPQFLPAPPASQGASGGHANGVPTVPPDQDTSPPFVTPKDSPLENAINSFLIRTRVSDSSTQPVGREQVIKALQSIYASVAVARLENLSAEGWTREVVQARILRRAEAMLPDAYADIAGKVQPVDVTLANLFNRAASSALPGALLEQEAVAFSISFKRFSDRLKPVAKQSLIPAAEQARAEAANEGSLRDIPKLLVNVDAEMDRTGFGLQGKLRARRILFDCVSQWALSQREGSPAAAAPDRPIYISETWAADIGSTCVRRIQSQFAPGFHLNPVPAGSVWTDQGPVLKGKQSEVTL